MSINKYTIYGERNSGTNYLKQLMDKNFDVCFNEINHKHFFWHNDLSNTDDILFIAIVRNPYDWLNSMYKTPYHIEHMKSNIEPVKSNIGSMKRNILHMKRNILHKNVIFYIKNVILNLWKVILKNFV